jgi:hypothetical protein
MYRPLIAVSLTCIVSTAALAQASAKAPAPTTAKQATDEVIA